MLISTIENFLGIRGKATKSGDFAQDILGNKVMEKELSMLSLVTMASQFSTPCFVKFCFFGIFLQILTKYFKQLVILTFEVNFGIFFGT